MDSEETLRRRRHLTDLLSDVAKGKEGALSAVYELTSPKLFGICLRISRNREIAEEVLQEVYIKIWDRAGRFDPERSSPMTWLAVIARNSAIDVSRRKRLPIDPEAILVSFADGAPLSDEVLIEGELKARILECMEKLHPDHRDCLRRAYFDGNSYSEVSKQIDTPLNTIKGWMRKAFGTLRECLDV